MALNWTMLNPDRSPVPLPHEMVIHTIDSGADIALIIPDTPPTGKSATAGGSGGYKTLNVSGGIWLTDQRLIIVTPALSDPTPSFESLSIPLHAILSTKFEQPLLGVNYLSMTIKPTPGGGLTDGTAAEIRLKDRAMFQFVSTVEKTRERVIYMKRQCVDDEEALPSYSEDSSSAGGSSARPDNPPGYWSNQ